MNLNARDRERFVEDGVLHLPGLISRKKTSAVKDAILAELARIGARVDGKWRNSKIAPLRHQRLFDDVIPPDLLPLLNELAGRALMAAPPHPQILLTPPQKMAWSVPHLGWHLDVKSPSRDEMPGIQVFVLIDDVAQHGGGTVAIAGSHKLHSPRNGVAVSAHQVLQAHPVYAALFSADKMDRAIFLEPQSIRNVVVRVIEMCGKAGDVYLMDMRIVHAAATNATKNARMMLTSRYLAQ